MSSSSSQVAYCRSCNNQLSGKVNHIKNEETVKKLNNLQRKNEKLIKCGDVVCRSCIGLANGAYKKKMAEEEEKIKQKVKELKKSTTSAKADEATTSQSNKKTEKIATVSQSNRKTEKVATVSQSNEIIEISSQSNEFSQLESQVNHVAEAASQSNDTSEITSQSNQSRLTETATQTANQDLKNSKDQTTQVQLRKPERRHHSTQTNSLSLVVVGVDANNNTNEIINLNNSYNGLLMLEQASRIMSQKNIPAVTKSDQTTQTTETESEEKFKSPPNAPTREEYEEFLFGRINEKLKHSLSFTDGIESSNKRSHI